MGSDDDDHRKHRSLPRVSHKVTLAAVSSLFALTLLVILLFLYAKYRQNRTRRSRRVSFVSRLMTAHSAAAGGVSDAPDAGASRKTPHGGLDPDVVRALPEFAYKPATPPGDAASAVECSVCLAGMTEGVKVRLLPNCGHTFHVECVDEWLASHTTCPLCRAEVEPSTEAESEAAPVVAEPSPEPTAPSVDEISLLNGAEPSAPPLAPESKGSGSRLSSFRKMLSRERTSSSSMRSLEDCGDQISSSVVVPQHRDLERQS